jgi:hypothetical protein
MFTTKELARLTGMNLKTIQKWIFKGWLRPAVRGLGGRGELYGHRWSPQQAIGMAAIAGMYQGIYSLGHESIKQLMADMEAITDRQIEVWLGPDDPWTQELGAVQTAVNTLYPVDPIPEEVEYRVNRVCQEIHNRLCGIRDRDRDIEPPPYRGLEDVEDVSVEGRARPPK